MKQSLFLFILVICSVSILFAQQKFDREQSGLWGYVKSVKTFTAEIESHNGKVKTGKRELDSYETFDVAGRRTSFVSYSDGKILSSETFLYGEKDQLIEKRSVHRKDLNLCHKKTYRYDDNTRLREEKCFITNGKLVGKISYHYDSDGLLSEKESISLDDQRAYFNNYVARFKYDDLGRIVESSTVKRTDSGLMPEDRRLGSYKTIFIFDPEGNISERHKFRSDDTLLLRSVSFYDSKGNEIETIDYLPDGSVKDGNRYAYEFDKQENWITETAFEMETEEGRSEFVPSERRYRIIEYFSKKEVKKFVARTESEYSYNRVKKLHF